jgi:hypothetical protein
VTCAVPGCRNATSGVPAAACPHPSTEIRRPGNQVRCRECDATWTEGERPPGPEPDENLARTKARPAEAVRHLDDNGRAVALTELCQQHRAEFEAQGWLASAEEETT